MTFIDFFSGCGAMRLGLEAAGHTCIGHCEIDKYAAAVYESVCRPGKEEWFHDDITTIRATDIPYAELWAGGFPCQDVSTASGARKGLSGKRSGLFYTFTGLVRESENKPKRLLLENVKGLFSSDRGRDFARLLFELDECGYDASWQVVNSKQYLPQNRERVFIVGFLREEPEQ